jgi:hypothetical protein
MNIVKDTIAVPFNLTPAAIASPISPSQSSTLARPIWGGCLLAQLSVTIVPSHSDVGIPSAVRITPILEEYFILLYAKLCLMNLWFIMNFLRFYFIYFGYFTLFYFIFA